LKKVEQHDDAGSIHDVDIGVDDVEENESEETEEARVLLDEVATLKAESANLKTETVAAYKVMQEDVNQELEVN